MKKTVLFVMFGFTALFGIVFALLNAQTVRLNYYLDSVDAPLSLMLAFGLVLGALLGVLASVGLVFRCRREVSRLRRSLQMAEKDLANLRALPFKDTR